MKPSLHVQGMHGMGDCLHQRAVARQLMQRYDVTLETSWPAIYHDLMAQGLKVARRPVALRTQTKNAVREADKFSPRHPFLRPGMRVAYTGSQVLTTPSKTILEVMCNVTGCNFAEADYRLPIPDTWIGVLSAVLDRAGLANDAAKKPWMFYRPLIARPEWRGSMARNADPDAYGELFNLIRDKFFVISVADLGHGAEAIVGPPADADVVFHQGELVFEALAALASVSALIFTSSGFPSILGPAVGTPTISIGGGYEDHRCHDSGARFAPFISIGPKVGCSCWTSSCRRVCNKTLNMDFARGAVLGFVEQTLSMA